MVSEEKFPKVIRVPPKRISNIIQDNCIDYISIFHIPTIRKHENKN